MPAELSEFLLLASAVLVLAAFFGRRLLRTRGHSAAANVATVVLTAAGLGLSGWVGWSNLAPRLAAAPPAPPAAVDAAADAAPLAHAEPVPTAIAALQDCPAATPPAAVPDATKASREQMLAARSAFQQYDAATNAFTKCVDLTIERVTKQFPQATAAELETLSTLRDGAHNTAVDQEQAVADELNAQVRAFKAKHPGN